jgi:alanine racemase
MSRHEAMPPRVAEIGHASSRVEISRSAYRKNLSRLQSLVGPDCAISSVVKGNAYGHGIANIVPLAEEWGIRHFCVFQTAEAREVVEASRADSAVLVLGFMTADEVEWAVEQGVSFAAFDVERIRLARAAAERVGRPALVHLDVETGMNRSGLDGADFAQAVDLVRTSPDTLRLDGLCTHYAGAESEGNFLRIRKQIAVFHDRLGYLRERGLEPRLLHTAGSAATFTYPETHFDLVRIGIAQYGFWPSQETRMRFLADEYEKAERVPRDPLRRVMRWVTSVMSVKSVAAGEFVGYGRSYLTTRRQRIASIPVGYAQGFPRVLSNLGFVLVRGQRAPVVGLVNMNLATIDVTEIDGVCPGDEVVLIGRQGRKEISVGWFGDLTRTLNYEVIVRIPREIPRLVTT